MVTVGLAADGLGGRGGDALGEHGLEHAKGNERRRELHFGGVMNQQRRRLGIREAFSGTEKLNECRNELSGRAGWGGKAEDEWNETDGVRFWAIYPQPPHAPLANGLHWREKECILHVLGSSNRGNASDGQVSFVWDWMGVLRPTGCLDHARAPGPTRGNHVVCGGHRQRPNLRQEHRAGPCSFGLRTAAEGAAPAILSVRWDPSCGRRGRTRVPLESGPLPCLVKETCSLVRRRALS